MHLRRCPEKEKLITCVVILDTLQVTRGRKEHRGSGKEGEAFSSGFNWYLS